MIPHFVFSVILHTFCMASAKYPSDQSFQDFTAILSGPHKNVKSWFDGITSVVRTKSSYRLLNIKYICHALAV